MIKGVNKQIIEINDIENEHFYKAILFVRPESSPRSHEFLSKKADEYISLELTLANKYQNGFLRTQKSKNKRRIILLLSALSLLLIGTVFIKFFL